MAHPVRQGQPGLPAKILSMAGALLVAGAAHGAAHVTDAALARFFDEFAAQWMRGNPNQAIATRYFAGAEQDALERSLTPESSAWRDARAELARRGLEELGGLDAARWNDAERVSADLLRWQLERVVEGRRFEDYGFPFEQNGGVNVRVPNALIVVHPMATQRDAENYVARLGQVGERLDEALADARALAAKGRIPPAFIVRATLAQMRQFAATPVAENPLVTKLPAAQAKLRARAEDIVRGEVLPRWNAVIAFLEALQPRATEDAGLWRFAGGDEAYRYHLKRYTTTALGADEIHAIGLREVARIEAEMDAILKGLGRATGTLNERIDALERELRYPHDDAGRAAIMADIERLMRDAEARLPALFERLPKAPVTARPYPRFREANAAASYTPAAPDGSRAAMFQMPLRPGRMTKYGLRTLVYHETVPGHHLQIALEMENEAQPRFRRARAFGFISAFGEGWALYAEKLADEAGWYEGDPVGRLGELDAQLFRARRLVADTGLHAKHWTREQAIAYGFEVSEVERYVMNPGQACAYMLGELKILELRERVRKALGDKFSLKDFHTLVLDTGTVPLELLERRVEAYIARPASTSQDPRSATKGRSS